MEKKYILTDETMEYYGHTLHRIKAIKDFENIKAGDLGGWIESERNLSHEGLCWIDGEAKVIERARIFDNAQVYEEALVYGEALVCGSAAIYGSAEVYGSTLVYGSAEVCEAAKIWGDAKIFEDAQISGNARVYKKAQVFGCSRVYEQARVHGEAIIYGTAHIFGSACAYGDAKVCWMGFVEEKVNLGRNAYVQTIKDYLFIGPIGSRGDFTTFYKTEDQGIWVSCGCFNGSVEDFKKTVREKHKGSVYAKEYLAAIKLARVKLS